MKPAEIRLECLRLALNATDKDSELSAKADRVVARAEIYNAFVIDAEGQTDKEEDVKGT